MQEMPNHKRFMSNRIRLVFETMRLTNLKRAHRGLSTAHKNVEKAENAIIKASDIQIGDKVRIIKNTTTYPPTATMAIQSQKYGNKLIGKETTIDNIRIHKDGILSYTTAIHDERSQRWCWSREELELI